MMMKPKGFAIADIAVIPVGTQQASIRDCVVAVERVLKRYPKIKAEINAMSTTLEGDVSLLFQAVEDMHEAAFEMGADRVTTTIRIDERRDGIYESMAERVQVVKERLQI